MHIENAWRVGRNFLAAIISERGAVPDVVIDAETLGWKLGDKPCEFGGPQIRFEDDLDALSQQRRGAIEQTAQQSFFLFGGLDLSVIDQRNHDELNSQRRR